MPSAIPTMKSYSKVAAGPEPHRNFIASSRSAIPGALTGVRQRRMGAMGDRMKSIIRDIGGDVNARDAQAAVYETAFTAGENLHV